MKCWHCNSKLIWGSDFNFADYGMEGDGIVTNLSCSKCEAVYEVYLPAQEPGGIFGHRDLGGNGPRDLGGNKL